MYYVYLYILTRHPEQQEKEERLKKGKGNGSTVVPTLLYFDCDEETRVDGLGLPAPLASKSAPAGHVEERKQAPRVSSTTVCMCVCVCIHILKSALHAHFPK